MRFFLACLSLLAYTVHVVASQGPTEWCGPNKLCRNYGRCINTGCHCVSGYFGDQCEWVQYCEDLRLNLTNSAIGDHSTDYNSVVRIQCKPGYQVPEVENEEVIYQRVVRCGADGQWGPDFRDCIALCPPVSTWRGYSVSTKNRTAGTTVQYQCKGYFPWYHKFPGEAMYAFSGGKTGIQTARCSETGEWVPNIVDCKEIRKE